MCAGLKMPAPGIKRKPISSYDDSFLNVFCVCELRFYDVFFFYHKAYLVFLLLIINFKYLLIGIVNLKIEQFYFSIFIRSSTSLL
ncbi:MAG: hypothetical protein JWP81_3098 [Ferruginibacter sp.]|nr:hypothetical protein [Ferruginibacter sp.]